MARTVYSLEISSWRGISIGAKHSYGKVTWTDALPDGTRSFHSAEVKAPGGRISFVSRDALVRCAMRWFERRRDPGAVLLLSNNSIMEPKPILAGPPEILDEGAALLERQRENDEPGGTDEEDDAVLAAWNALLGR